ncbi:MAG TPA: hypothetical protein DCY02_03555 [Armatimonadetes bacterium]|nr:hypothetical protein [Armatimonadota bacterium]
MLVVAATMVATGVAGGSGQWPLALYGLAVALLAWLAPARTTSEAQTDLIMALTAAALFLWPEGWMLGIALAVVSWHARRRENWTRLLAWLGLLITMMLSGEAGSASRMAQWFVSLGMSEATAQTIMFGLRKSIHVLGYAAVAVTAARLVSRERWFFALGWGLLLASADELRQSREATRTGTWTDVAIDAVGMGLGLALWYGYTRRKGWSGDS